MTEAEREHLKENLRGAVAGRFDGIDLETPFHWAVEGVTKPVLFFANLPSLLPAGSIIYLEDCSIAPEIAAFYDTHRASNAVEVVRDTIFPVPQTHHVVGSAKLFAGLQQFAMGRSSHELFDHIKAYQDGRVLFTFHDAFDNWLLISDYITKPSVAVFCKALNATYRREQTKKRDLEQLSGLLRALENPGKVRIHVEGEAWWRRAWRRIIGR